MRDSASETKARKPKVNNTIIRITFIRSVVGVFCIFIAE